MNKADSLEISQLKEEEWQIHQPKDQGLSILKAFNMEITNLLKLILGLCILYLILTLLSPITIFVICLLIGTTVKLIKIKTSEIRKEGLINRLSPKWRQILFEKSIFDIYSDLLYFPLITKIIGAFVKPLIVKPHPEELHHTFQSLPQKLQKTIARKGLLSLAPSMIQDVIVDSQRKQHLPKAFGSQTWQWKNYQKYENHHEKVHQNTIAKKIVQKVDDKVSWPGFMIMASIVALGVYKMKPSKIQKMMIQNGSFVGLLIVSLIALIKIKKLIEESKKKRQTKRQMEALRITLLEKDE